MIDQRIKINKSISNLRVMPDTDELIINEVREVKGDTVIVFEAKRYVAFDTSLFMGE
ncbi:MAG: hypothetical protein GX895_13355 [Clostridiales bacterium]|uniref:hypothetical protein n=1 Tax=Clostridium sp. N3C TaxID=1776758 RepID=UPI00092DEF30|nr:hypothetical protein [Clostridium sp. N3C]NLZ49737.1 hypothetical protein [Clostridiales bacterium]SCN25265.1 hypothetical protein N3C_2240 [Clostridium sp. N3C]